MENPIPHQTDKQIIDDTRELAKECQTWADEDFSHKEPTERGLWARGYFIYLQKKLFNHSPKYYREQDLKSNKFSGTKEPIIRGGE